MPANDFNFLRASEDFVSIQEDANSVAKFYADNSGMFVWFIMVLFFVFLLIALYFVIRRFWFIRR